MSEQTINKNKNKKRLFLIIGLIAGACLLLLIGAGIAGISYLSKNIGLPVEVETPEINDISSNVTTSGMVTSAESTTYTTSIAAIVDEINIRPGQTIKAGDTIMTFDVSELENQYDQASLNARSTELTNQSTIEASDKSSSQLAQAKQTAEALKGQIATLEQEIADLQSSMAETGANDLTNAIMEKRNQLTLVLEELQAILDAQPVGSDLSQNPDYQEKCAERDALNSSISNLEAIAGSTPNPSEEITALIAAKSSELASLQGELTSQEALIQSMESGVLTATQREQLSIARQLSSLQLDAAAASLEEGKAGVIAEQDGIITSVDITKGSTAAPGYPLFTVASTDNLKVTVSLTQKELETVELGQSATVTILNREYEGTVTYISHMASVSATGATTIEAEITLQNPDKSVILGVDAKVVIHTASKQDVLTIPNAALNVDNTGTFVYTVEDNVVTKTYITTGINDDLRYEVLDGITENTMIIVNVTAAIQEGIPVMPTNSQSSEKANTATDQN